MSPLPNVPGINTPLLQGAMSEDGKGQVNEEIDEKLSAGTSLRKVEVREA